jgi:DNA polymerase II
LRTTPTTTENAFLLTRQWRDGPRGVTLVFWARGESGPIRIELDAQEAVAFVESGRIRTEELGCRSRPLALRTLHGLPVDGLYFPTRRALVDARARLRARGVPLYESDVKPSDRFLMEHFITGGLRVEGRFIEHERFREYKSPRVAPVEVRPELTVLSLDIETDGHDETLYSIAASIGYRARVFLLRLPEWDHSRHGERIDEEREEIALTVHHDEATLLEEFFAFLKEVDPDVLIGWNVVEFDLDLLERTCRRLNLAFALGRGRDRATVLDASSPGGRKVARIPGRAVLDGIDTLRTATWAFEDFGLEAVAQELLGRGKLIEHRIDKIEEIRRLYREQPWDLVRYNVEDCRLVEEIFERTELVEFALERAQLTGLALDRVGGSVAAFDNLYLPRLHRKGRVARDVEEQVSNVASPGGYVLDSEPGLFDNVLVLDFKSLYPSIIRSFLVDPLGLAEAEGGDGGDGAEAVPGFQGARFSRERHILPGLIEDLWRARDRAKAAGNAATSRAIKIIMNSFYGVLGTPGCRFFEPRLAASVTLRGHEIITRSREWIEQGGRRVIYGDTDSLFVLLGPGPSEDESRRVGQELAARLNRAWAEELAERHRLASYLELQFHAHYRRFFMPTIRGSELGSKKRYAGLVRRDGALVLEFTGLEAVRSDWTPLAREFQRELYRRIFFDEPFEDYVRGIAADLFAGKRDRDLVYRKRVRRRLEDYRKNVPPHVQAALKSPTGARRERWVRYVVTTSGPEPLDNNPSSIDHRHYLDRQLAPAADALLRVKGTSVADILDAQLRLF